MQQNNNVLKPRLQWIKEKMYTFNLETIILKIMQVYKIVY